MKNYYRFQSCPRAPVNTPTFCLTVVQRDLDHLDILQHNPLVHYFNDIMFIGQVEQQMANILKVLVKTHTLR